MSLPIARPRLARLATRIVLRPRVVLLTVLVVAALGGALGSTLLSVMSSDVGDPHAESRRAVDRVVAASGTGVTPDDLVLLVDVPSGWPSSAAAATVRSVVDRVRATDGVVTVVAPTGLDLLQAQAAGLASMDGERVLVTAGLRGSADQEAVARSVETTFHGYSRVQVGGPAAVSLDIDNRIAADLTRAEVLVFPILLLLGFWIFRGIVAALVPLLTGFLSIATTLGALRLVDLGVDLSQYVLNLVIGLGLGLAIDYCLFIVSRYREEVLVDGYGRPAVVRAVTAAGHTVLFSAATVALAMSTLMLFPQRFLYSMGIGGVLVTLIAAALAVTLLPALLVMLGPRIDTWSLPRWRRARVRESADVTAGRWYALSRSVTRYAGTLFPLAVLVGLFIASPALDTRFGDVGASSLPTSSTARQVSEQIASEFPYGNTSPLVLTVTAGPTQGGRVESLAAAALGAAGGSAREVAGPRYVGRRVWVVVLSVEGTPYSDGATSAVDRVRAQPSDLPVLVGGSSAEFVDLESSIGSHLPWALLIASVAVLLVMLRLTGSVVLALKTLVLNVLNVAMTFGALVWVFQEGHLEGLWGFTSTGRIDLMQPILVAIISFGLSTDYGVFLFARIVEAHDEGVDDEEAVARGLGRSGRIISSAALLLCIAIGAFSSSSILFIKQLGVGAAVAVFLDATLVRALLVPSAMRLLGAANWWAPGWLHGLTGRPGTTRVRRARPGRPTYAQLVDRLRLEPHPEGGWYRQTWASDHGVRRHDGDVRPTATMIYFLLPAGEASAWHRVVSDEVWLSHQGQVRLQYGGRGERPVPGREVVLGPAPDGGQVPQALVPAGTWQRTVPGRQDALVSCLVSPGFDFADFELA